MTNVVTARELVEVKLCTGQCLLAVEPWPCKCRCRSRWHGVLADAEITVPGGLTLAEALGARKGGRKPNPAPTSGIQGRDGLVSIRDAVTEGIFGYRSLAAVRKALQRARRNGDGPHPVGGDPGGPPLYSPGELAAFAERIDQR